MDVYGFEITVYLCAPSLALLKRGRSLFKRLVHGGTIITGKGFWMDDPEELTLMIQHWTDSVDEIARILRYAKYWQAIANQTAIGIRYLSPHGFTARVIYSEADWLEFTAELLQRV